MYNEVNFFFKETQALHSGLSHRREGAKIGGLCSSGSGDEQVMRDDQENKVSR